MRITNTGKVGIGTNNPQKMLEVIVGENNFASFATQFSPGSHAGIHFGYRENNNSYRHSQLRFQRTDRFANNAMGRVMLINKTGTDSANPGESDAHLTIDELGFVGIGRNVGGHYSTGPRIQALLHVSASGTVVGSTTASLYVEGSGSEVVSVDGTLGRLFTVSDNFSGSLFSANTISGTPVIEAFSDNSVHLGPFSNPIQVTSLGHISGSSITTASFGRLQATTLGGNSPLNIDSPKIINGIDSTGDLTLKSDGVTAVTIYDSGGAGLFRAHTSIRNGDGSAASPAYTFNNDANTGFYRRTDDQIGVSMIGSLCFWFQADTFRSSAGPGIMNEYQVRQILY